MGTKLLPQYRKICAFKPTSHTASFCSSNEIRRLFVKSGNSLRGKLHGFKPQRNEADKSGKKERPRHARRVGKIVAVQGTSKRFFPGWVKSGEKVAFCLPTAGKQTQYFHHIFSQPGKSLLASLLEVPCSSYDNKVRVTEDPCTS